MKLQNINQIEHLYAADGRRLKTIHRTSVPQSPSLGIGVTASLPSSLTQSIDSVDYVGNFIYEKGQLKRYMFDDGYLRLNTNNTCVPRFFIKDHLGNNRILTDGSGNIKQNTNYYPYGGMTSISTGQGEQQFKYNGKEYDPMHGLNEYDYGARQYDPARGQFTTMDPLCEKYYHISPYAYCGGNPVNAVDVDGRLIIFINGWNYGNKGVLYWGKFDDKVMNHFHDDHVKYLDGSIGGIFNTIAAGILDPTSLFFNNLNPHTRFSIGFLKGSNDVEKIINSLEKDKNGVITETMRLVTHSMGAAYAKGYATAIMEYVEKHPEETQGFKLIEYDFAPFQPEQQKAVNGVTTYQYVHSDDPYDCYKYLPGAKMMNATSREGGHFLKEFLKYIPELPTGEDNIKKDKEKMK